MGERGQSSRRRPALALDQAGIFSLDTPSGDEMDILLVAQPGNQGYLKLLISGKRDPSWDGEAPETAM
ncbi:hypothetical protein ENH_00026150 [Eimeria necatrix]|uniref:Uncharacterized protein n=1 Tax=Eimeria necatrix TaxID=51315 RepID=U6MYF4_9EIME|nr:hypothetical protein ENH_00026150 [Eimeria necatrix]CDJ66730.1 hypothetical protein ENH_00026150 [Eimeria necatrix]